MSAASRAAASLTLCSRTSNTIRRSRIWASYLGEVRAALLLLAVPVDEGDEAEQALRPAATLKMCLRKWPRREPQPLLLRQLLPRQLLQLRRLLLRRPRPSHDRH